MEITWPTCLNTLIEHTLSVKCSNRTVISKQGLDNWGSPVWCKLTALLTFHLHSYHINCINFTKVIMYLCIMIPSLLQLKLLQISKKVWYPNSKNLVKKGKAQKVQVPERLKGLISNWPGKFFWTCSVRH